jgi:heptosyltransferase I
MSTTIAPPPKKICLLRLSSIGDVCHAVSMVQAIQRQYPDAQITWILGKGEATLVGDLAGVETIVYDKKQGWAGLMAVREALRGKRFDVLLHMQIALRASLVSLLVRARLRIGFDKARAGEGQWLFTNHRIAPQLHAHVLDSFKAFAAEIGVADYHPEWDIPVSEQDQAFAAAQITDDCPTLAIVPAASKAERNWPSEYYAAMADYAAGKGFKIVLCGGPTELEQLLGAQITQASNTDITNLIGKTSLKQLLAVLRRASLVLAPDTGPAHMAVTQGTPVIGLYCHSNPRRTGPYLSQDYVINHYDQLCLEQHGKPWQELPWGTRVKGAELMRGIQPSEVEAMFEHVVAERKLLTTEKPG